jgi:uncharacterized protein
MVLSKLFGLEQPLRKLGVASLALFGSFARGVAGPKSDVDVLIDLVPKRRFSLVDLVSLKNLMEGELGRSVDVVTRDGLDPHIRDRILGEAQKVF